ncbi:septum formation family protein [Yinghuangia soli]|uniref:Septum formation family protein n=1 Tax=Yinghuangia soli TaxID=2908204 RepID=A0AA41PXC1_9ACTN|nr:septum formation family protein [Yinghuangia soli]MCF2527618.1 septum formation family protein [Yinghuangia soli]
MRSLRSTRSTALRLTAAAASGIVAMSVLTGCLGKEDKDKAAGTGSSSAPSAPAGADAGAPGSADPSAPGGTGTNTGGTSTGGSSTGGGTGKPTSIATGKVNKLDLKVGDCIDFEDDNTNVKASCTGEHDAEAVAIYAMPASMTPTSMTYRDDVKAKCMEFIRPIVDRQPDPSKYAGTWIFPDSASWMNNDRTLQCLVMHRDQTPMPAGKLK